jgi:hypothetical protein
VVAHLIGMKLGAMRLIPILLGCVALAGCNGGVTTAQQVDSPASSSPAWDFVCTSGTGPGCGTPEPIADSVVGTLWTGTDGRTLNGRFGCGGALVAKETAANVYLTFTRQIVQPGAMACALPVVTVSLKAPLGARVPIDATTGAILRVASAPPSSPASKS